MAEAQLHFILTRGSTAVPVGRYPWQPAHLEYKPFCLAILVTALRSCSPLIGHACACSFASWRGCNGVPEDMHPKSFRSYMGHNTNIWATRARSSMQVTLHADLPGPCAGPACNALQDINQYIVHRAVWMGLLLHHRQWIQC